MYNNRKKEAHMKKRRKSVENLAVRSKMLNFAVKYRICMNKKSTMLLLMSVFMFAFAQTAQVQDRKLRSQPRPLGNHLSARIDRQYR